jgi:GrpB-like predicted nucleotidyltransferase (UPF0157 family)
MADQSVEITDYDPAWAVQFDRERERTRPVLTAWLAGPIEHIGSTSVPGLAAKPVVDMLAPVASLAAARAAVAPLTEAGWVFWAGDPCATYRLWFLRPDPRARTHHLQILERDDIHAIALLAFRDALRADATMRDEYAQLTQGLAGQHRGNRNAYTNAKAEFVARVLDQAGVAVPPRDPLPE